MYLFGLWNVIMFGFSLFSDSESTYYDVHDLMYPNHGHRNHGNKIMDIRCVHDLGFSQSKKRLACKTSMILKELDK